MTPLRAVASRRATLHVVTVLVALCSFAYELVYSELLTVVYGGTVVQYGLTIGLFFSSLGLGSLLARHFDETRAANFLRTELYLAVAAPAGFLFVVWLDAGALPAALPAPVEQVAARLPVVLVGALSGFELPLLLAMARDEAPPRERSGWLRTAADAASAASYRVVSLFFHASRESEAYDDDSAVLAADYVGGLAGALLFVFVLYPRLGLVSSVVVLALLNCVAAILFAARFGALRWRSDSDPDASTVATGAARTAIVACLLLSAVYAGATSQHERLESAVTEYHFEHVVEQEYPPGTVDVSVREQETTRHQRVVTYERTWTGESENRLFAGQSETCMRLDRAVQLCESWADSYHRGLVDVPMTLFENGTGTNVLLAGGGDWIAADRLREHGVSVDQVDLDREFMAAAKSDPLLARYHDDAHEYRHLESHQADVYRYLQETDEQYDLILLDLPGARNSDLLHLYSEEFYSLLRTHLREDGVVATWTYSPYAHGTHSKVYRNTVAAAGFDWYLPYAAHDDLDRDGAVERGERFALLSPGDDRSGIEPANGSAYVRRYDERYASLEWRPVPTYEGVEPNGVFDPNYDVLVDRGVSGP